MRVQVYALMLNKSHRHRPNRFQEGASMIIFLLASPTHTGTLDAFLNLLVEMLGRTSRFPMKVTSSILHSCLRQDLEAIFNFSPVTG